MKTFSLHIDQRCMTENSGAILQQAFARKLRERGCAAAADGYEIGVSLSPSLKEDAFELSCAQERARLLVGGACAAFAGIGEFLLRLQYDGRGVPSVPCCTVEANPKRPVRGLYFATHFHNFYHVAPINEVLEQVEDVALRGGNAIAVWYDMHHYGAFEEPASLQMAERLKAILKHARAIGMRTCMTMLSNEAFNGTPQRLRARAKVENGYHAVLDGHYGVEICPSQEGGIDEIIRQRRIVLEGFADCQPDFVVYWPYDQGGCTCAKCAPWGTNGFIRLFPYFKDAVRDVLPKTKIIVSTWYFDRFIDGEWSEFHRLAAQGAVDGAEYLLDFFPLGKLPACVEEKGLPAGKKMLAFPEISMYGGKPWGGFGANPLPAFLQRSNDKGMPIYSGQLCYSEGIFEDINKFIMLNACSDRQSDAREAIADYARSVFMLDDARDVVRLAEMLEETLPREETFEPERIRYIVKKPERIKEAALLADALDARIPEPARSGWRWRILYLRAHADQQLMQDNWQVTPSCDVYLEELEKIYRISPDSLAVVSPPTTALIRKRCAKKMSIW